MLKQRPTIRDHSAEANLFARRAFVGFVFVLGLVAILLSNLYTIQVEDHQDYQTRSNDNRIKVIPIAPNVALFTIETVYFWPKTNPCITLRLFLKRWTI